ncbi:MAG: uroporphyrinogen decarboxylase [Actinomycetota bacterium]
MNESFLSACRSEPVGRTPVWYMRQAGRFLPEYRELRERYGILEICRTPELAAEVTLMPVRRMDVDAAVLFSDIMIPVAAMGVDLQIEAGRGPVIERPLSSVSDVERLRAIDPAKDLSFIEKAVQMLVVELDVPLIGFSGGPFTLASYLIEGGPSRSFARTKSLMFGDPEAWRSLMERLTQAIVASLRSQIDAGASAVQVFDSWVGTLSAADYAEHVLPYSKRVFAGVEHLSVPRIHFAVGASHLLEQMRDAGADVVGVDWRLPIDVARERLGSGVAVQGNLEPAALLGPFEGVEEKTRDILRRAGEAPGHIFNLGHGVLPDTDPDSLHRLTELVHEVSAT